MHRPAPSLKGRALRLLSQREHSRAELERKLARFAADDEGSSDNSGELAANTRGGTPTGQSGAEQLRAVLDDLQAKDFISDARTVESVVRVRAQRFGAARVRQELQRKGIADDAIADALASLKDSELARASAVWRQRFDALPQDQKERGKQGRFLMARGFSGEVVSRVLRGGAVPTDAVDHD